MLAAAESGICSILFDSWIMSHYTMLYKYGQCTCSFLRQFHFYVDLVFLYYEGIFSKAIISHATCVIVVAIPYPTYACETIVTV